MRSRVRLVKSRRRHLLGRSSQGTVPNEQPDVCFQPVHTVGDDDSGIAISTDASDPGFVFVAGSSVPGNHIQTEDRSDGFVTVENSRNNFEAKNVVDCDNAESHVFVFGELGSTIAGSKLPSDKKIYHKRGGKSRLRKSTSGATPPSSFKPEKVECAKKPSNLLESEMRKLTLNHDVSDSLLKDTTKVFVFGKTAFDTCKNSDPRPQLFVFNAKKETAYEEPLQGCVGGDESFCSTPSKDASSAQESLKGENECEKTAHAVSFGSSFSEFIIPNLEYSCLKEGLFPAGRKGSNFGAQNPSKIDKRANKFRNLPRKSFSHKKKCGQGCSSSKSSCDSPVYSPMDSSPFSTASEHILPDNSVTDNIIDHDIRKVHLDNERKGLFSVGDNQELAGNENSAQPQNENDEMCDHPNDKGTERKCSLLGVSASPEVAPFKSISAGRGSSRRLLRRKKNTNELISKSRNAVLSNQRAHDNNQSVESNKSNFEASDYCERESSSNDRLNIEICEAWRQRGNHAFKSGNALKAEEFYTCGINAAASCETSGSYVKLLAIGYSNRAAARMSLNKIREATMDCLKAIALDPCFLKARHRAANCYLLLGEVENALKYYSMCLESAGDICLDRRLVIDAANGVQQCQKVTELVKSVGELFEQRTSDSALRGLDIITTALSISPLSENLLEMKAWFLFLLYKYDEVIQLCESTRDAAEKNLNYRVWRLFLMSKSYFYIGHLVKSLHLLEKFNQEPLDSCTKEARIDSESIATFVANLQKLLSTKNAGNAAYQSGRFAEAVEHYSNALSVNLRSRPFAAICFCNRAASYQGLGQIADAIADCSLSIAVDKNYSKAVSRRSLLYEMIRSYEEAANDIKSLISLLQGQCVMKSQTEVSKELRQAQSRLSMIEEATKKDMSLDLYLILGVKESHSASDIKRAYRKAALRHHPDKACQFFSRNECEHEEPIWREILQEVHMNADRLFKMIGEAYSVLSDPAKRRQYDIEEQLRKHKDLRYSPKSTSECGFPNTRNYHRTYDRWTSEK